MGFIYRNSIKGISRGDIFYVSLDINAFGMIGIRNIVVVKIPDFRKKNWLGSLLVQVHNNLARSRVSDF